MRTRELLFGLLVSLALPACGSQNAPPGLGVPSTPAALGVYEGAGCDGAARLKDFARWLGRNPDQVIDFVAWDMLEDRGVWLVRCWSTAGQKSVVFSVPMLPSGRPATLAEGASGKYDALFHDFAELLVKYGYDDAVIRIGWEFNGDWYPWAASKDPASWVAYWRRIVDAMRSVPGTNFRFDWCPAAGWTRLRADQVYPGDQYVDIVGLDFYNVNWDPGVVTAVQRWNSLQSGPHGLNWHRDFADQHGKARSFPEWGTGTRRDGHGGGDDPYFVEQMAAWLRGNDIAYHNYWDYAHPIYNGKLSDGHQPLSGAAFLNAFGSK